MPLTLDALVISSNANLVEILIPSLPKITYIRIFTNQNLTSITVPLNLVSQISEGYALQDNKFPSAIVNSILASLVKITPLLVNRQIQLKQTVPAPPTGQGITDKNTLIANGNTVSTD